MQYGNGGNLTEIWFDGGIEGESRPAITAMLKKLQPKGDAPCCSSQSGNLCSTLDRCHSTRAERGKQEIIPARRAHAAHSTASESRGLKGPFQLRISILILLFPRTRRGWWYLALVLTAVVFGVPAVAFNGCVVHGGGAQSKNTCITPNALRWIGTEVRADRQQHLKERQALLV